MTEPLRFSRLRLIGRSPRHCKEATEESTTYTSVGTGAHSMILGGRPVLAWEGKQRRGNDFDAFAEDNPTALILTKAEFAQAAGIAKAVKADRDAQEALEGIRERTVLWNWNGRPCRGTPDVARPGAICELKTGVTSDPAKFGWQCLKFSYHAALAWYAMGLKLAGEKLITDVKIVAVEQKAPHVVTVFKVLPSDLERGSRLVRTWLERLDACEKADAWPGYAQGVVDLSIPETESIVLEDSE